MPLPVLLLWGAAAALGATGIVKGTKAKKQIDQAREIGERAERRHRQATEATDAARAQTQETLEALGRLKVHVFTHHIKHLVEALKKGRSRLGDFEVHLNEQQLREYEGLVLSSLELERGLGSGALGGALAAMGAYGAVGTLATASTGAAISGLSGVAATNATLAWLGGGALSAGGLGMTGGMITLAGIALGPALAIGGFMMASKAEEAMTEAQAYKARVAEAVGELEKAQIGLAAIRTHAAEATTVIERLAQVFDQIKVEDDRDPAAFARMVMVGRALKEALEIRLMGEDGGAIDGVSARYSGLMEVVGSEARS